MNAPSVLAVPSAPAAMLLERGAALATLSAHLGSAAADQGGVVLLRGEAGVGKSTLVRRFAELAEGRARVLRGACDPVSTPSPLAPLLDMTADLGPRLGRAVDEALSGAAAPHVVFRELLADLQRAEDPTLLIVEDLHWADSATLDLVRFLGRRIAGLPVLVLGTYRDDEVGGRHPLTVLLGDMAAYPTLHRLTVEPLTRSAVERMAAGRSLDPTALYQVTGGNPFFVTEVVASGSVEVPASVSEVVLGRLARMPETARAVAEAVAIIGSPAEETQIAALVRDLRGVPGSVLEHGLLHAVDGGIAFRHELARLAVLESIPAYRRTGLHGRALAMLRSLPGRVDGFARLAYHAEESGDSAAVLEFAVAAGARASTLQSHAEAAAQYARALRHADREAPERRADLYEEHSCAAFLAGDIEVAVASRRAAVELRRALGDLLREGDDLRWLAHMLWPIGRMRESLDAAGAAERLLEALPPGRELAEVYLHQCMERSYHADVDATAGFAQRAIELAADLDDSGIAARARYYLARAEVSRTGHGWDEVELALEAAAETDVAEHSAFLFMTASAVASLHRDQRGVGVLKRAEQYCGAHDLLTYLLATRASGLLHSLHQGRWAEAAATAEEILDHPRAAPIVRAPALAALGLVRARRGDPDSSAPLDEAARLLEPGFVLHMTPVWEARAEAAWLAGDDERARAEAGRGLAALGERSDPWLCGALARLVYLTGGQPPPYPTAGPFALELAGGWRAAAAEWEELGCTYDAALARLSGDTAAVLRALETFETLGTRPAAERARARLRSFGIRSGMRGPRPATRANSHGLTPRQVEIIGLVAEGLTDAQIAARLHLSAKTVNHHVGAVLAKLGVHSRADAVRTLTR